jgi:hypothetical protein
MIMRFHWGLAVGHVYTHDDSSNATGNTEGCSGELSTPEEAPDTIEETYVSDERREYSLVDCDHVDWDKDSDRDEDV